MHLLLGVLWALVGALPRNAAAETVQDFNVPGKGTPCIPIQSNNPPPPERMPGGPIPDGGKFLRLASANPTGAPNSNTITCRTTDRGRFDLVVADFDFRMSPGVGRADGLGFALLNTRFFSRKGGIVPQGPLFAVEEPNFAGSVGVGFDLFRNGVGCSPHAQGFPDDIGNDNIRPCFSNSLSIHFDGRIIEQFDISPIIDLASGRWIHARVVIRAGGKRPSRNISVIFTPQGCAPAMVVDRLRIPGLRPYEGRVHFGARSGGDTADHDLDNVNVQFLTTDQSLVALDPLSLVLSETDARATLTITRLGNTKVPVEVLCTATNGTAKRRRDYVATSTVVRFPPGRKRAKCRIPLLDDRRAENDEFFFVSLKAASEGVLSGGPSKIAVGLFDDETAASTGHWQPAGCWPVVAIHMHLLPSGRVMAWDRFGTVRTWDPTSAEIRIPAQPPHNVFCSGHAFLPDGSLLVTGGHHPEGSPADDGLGVPDVTRYDPAADSWSDSLPLMNDGRWYPGNTPLASGDMLVLSGSTDRSFSKNTLPQVWESLVQGWRNLTGAEGDPLNPVHLGVDLYPRAFLAPDGRVVKVGPDALTSFLGTAETGQWFTGPSSSARRLYGSAAMYESGQVVIVGGSPTHDPGVLPVRQAEKIDLNAANPQWESAGSLVIGRKHLNATALPDGRVLVTGGTSGDGFSNPAFAEFTAELWDPASNSFSSMAAMQVPRLYHSTALLLPDGRVLSAGGGQGAFATRFHTEAEVYSPPYLFRGARPVITSAPDAVFLGESFFVETAEAPVIVKASLIRLPSVTHAFDHNQRYVSLAFSPDAGGLRITVPPNSNLVPPGHYMLFIVDGTGVPSVARIIRIIAQS